MGKKKKETENVDQKIEDTLAQITVMVETMDEIYFKNMQWLKKYDKKLYKKLDKVSNKLINDKSKEKYAVELNKEAALDIINKKDKTFLYNCEPFIYGDNKVLEVKKAKKFGFIGTGLGTHITSIIREIKPRKSLICEDDVQIFRCSLYVTDYESLSNISKIKFAIDSKYDISNIDEVVRFDKY